MTILYIDTEHRRVAEDPVRGATWRARLDSTIGRLAAAAEEPCEVVHFSEMSPRRFREAAPTALVLGGRSAAWDSQDEPDAEGLLDVIRTATTPMLGICMGHQLIGYAYGVKWAALGPLAPGEVDPDPGYRPGQRKESGFVTLQVDPRCAIFGELGASGSFWESHAAHLPAAPLGFSVRAGTSLCPVQAIEHTGRPIFGVQFHPGCYDDRHQDGRVVLRSFFRLARGVGRKGPCEPILP